MQRVLILAIALAGLSVLAPAHAAERKQDAAASEQVEFNPANFDAQRKKILRDMETDAYREISARDKTAVKEALERMAKRLDGVDSIEALEIQVRLDLFNDQELINEKLTSARADSRLICVREKKVGSHFATNHCMTAASRQRLATDSQAAIRKTMRTIPPKDAKL